MLNAQQIIDEGLLQLERTQGKPAQVHTCKMYDH